MTPAWGRSWGQAWGQSWGGTAAILPIASVFVVGDQVSATSPAIAHETAPADAFPYAISEQELLFAAEAMAIAFLAASTPVPALAYGPPDPLGHPRAQADAQNFRLAAAAQLAFSVQDPPPL